VTAVRYDDPRGVRYRFHDLVRVYATEELDRSEPADQRDAALRRLLGGWLALAESAHRAEMGGDYTVVHGSALRWRPDLDVTGDPMGWLDRERAGLVAAVHQAAGAGLDELAWDLAMTLITLFEHKGYGADWLATATVAREAAERAGNRLGRAAMLYSLGALHVQQTFDFDRAAKLFGHALDEFRALGNDHATGLAQRNLANVHRRRGDWAAARSHGEESLGLLRSAGDRTAEAHMISRLALVELSAGDPAAARRLADQALALMEQIGYRRGVAQTLYVSSLVYAASGDIEAARSTQQRVLESVRELDDPVGMAYAHAALARIELSAGRPEQAAELLRQTVELARAAAQFALAQQAQDELDAIGQPDR
jgi:tetratricopeptide (TPR) repeat protein